MKREYLPLESLPTWLRLNGVLADGVEVQNLSSLEKNGDKGNGIVAVQDKSSEQSDALPKILLQIPSDLLLSLDAVHNYSKSDGHLREVLEAVGNFGRVCFELPPY